MTLSIHKAISFSNYFTIDYQDLMPFVENSIADIKDVHPCRQIKYIYRAFDVCQLFQYQTIHIGYSHSCRYI